MLINVILLVAVFGATKWKKWPYAGAVLLGVIKGVLYFIGPLKTQPLWLCLLNGLIGFVIFGGLAWAFVYLLRRLDRDQPAEASYSTPGTETVRFRWEYIPLTLALLGMIFAELIIGLISLRS